MDFHFSPFLHTLILSGDDLYEHVFQLSFAMLPLLLHALSTQRIYPVSYTHLTLPTT